MNWLGYFAGSFSSVANDAPVMIMVPARFSSALMVLEKPVESP
ncbi:Uncharacterised protein [Bordetella pertussis]|nr:Uncharacterised protein [Bordetella pertussis]CFO67027.1 Uncharacterised protein [Bordetella pertussis]CPI24376.1 Uncharacterised protein [Bordetella pertussis]CPK90119.1 Uncharacterised protein [Bordetella pertussis]CPK95434.1 Uncharacterised protein [Bordetella pertussis]